MTRMFPIKQDPACLLKWGWSSVYLDTGTTSSCHRTKKFLIDPGNFDDFHNLPEKIQDRKAMLAGEWCGNGCEYCAQVEQAGMTSDRMMQLTLQQDPTLTPPELHTDPISTRVTPTMLEVWFTNTCNMKCVYCNAFYSSQWEDEDRRYGHSSYSHQSSSAKRLPLEKYNDMKDALWRYLHDHDRYRVLRRYHVLGGEPFLLEGMDQSLDFWNDHPNPDLVFSVISNLNIPHKRLSRYFDRFQSLVENKKISRLQITASLDAWGPQQVYARHGLDLELWQQNFESVLAQPWAEPSINSTISALTIKELPELMRKINGWNRDRDRPIEHSFNYTVTADNPFIFGRGVFDHDFKQVIDLMPEDLDHQVQQKAHMEGIAGAISKSVQQPDKIRHLQLYLDELDARRGTNWRDLFTWLDRDFSVQSI